MRGLFVTGTDTGIGKTLVSCAILRALAKRGQRTFVYKPAETGCLPDEHGALRGQDCERLARAADRDQPLESVSSALFPVPAAPLVAAEAAGDTIAPADLVRDARALAAQGEALLVEGAGGLLVPIAPGFTYAELVVQLGLPVLVVVGSRLGCLNHALLTLAELEHRGVEIAGYVLNELQPANATHDERHAVVTHRATLARFARARDLGALPFIAPGERDDPEALAELAERHLDLDSIAAAMTRGPG